MNRHLDRIEIEPVGRQEEESGSPLLEDRLGLCAFVAGQVVEDHHIVRLKGRGQLGLNVRVEDLAVHGLIDYPRRD